MTRKNSGGYNPANRDFTCTHCGQLVTADSLIAGVQNRNHCPYCLWSRHVDSSQAGDRLAACKGSMKPVALTIKRVKKKYGPARGELMLVHRCEVCGKISINRIAADDSPSLILSLFEESLQLDDEFKQQLQENGIELLEEEELPEVKTQLFGRDYDS